ncbi:MAG: hypothetical protein R3F18_01435 [Lysobacterales bacterium]
MACDLFLPTDILSLIFRPAQYTAARNRDRLKSLHDPFAAGRLLARRVVQTQLWTGGLMAVTIYAVSLDGALAAAAAWGAAAVAAAQAMFARRQLRGMTTVQTMLRRFYSAAAWKWLVVFALFMLGLTLLRLPAGGLITGFIAAQMAGTWALLRYG